MVPEVRSRASMIEGGGNEDRRIERRAISIGNGSMTERLDRTDFAIFLMVAAMVGFALADTLIKWSSETAAGGAATGQIMVYLGISGLIPVSYTHLTLPTILLV